MLPSRLFRNTGIPPPLRSLLTPSPSLPATYVVQLRLRLGIMGAPALGAPSTSRSRHFHSTSSSTHESSPNNASTSAAENEQSSTRPDAEEEEKTVFRQPIGKMEPRLSLTFTCTVEGCGERSSHEFSRHAYEKGIVLVQCPGCNNRHLIADHLGWFKESTKDGKLRTVEDLLNAKGEMVKRGRVGPDGTIEFT